MPTVVVQWCFTEKLLNRSVVGAYGCAENNDETKSFDASFCSRIRRRSHLGSSKDAESMCSGRMIHRTGFDRTSGLAEDFRMNLSKVGSDAGSARPRRWIEARGMLDYCVVCDSVDSEIHVICSV